MKGQNERFSEMIKNQNKGKENTPHIELKDPYLVISKTIK